LHVDACSLVDVSESMRKVFVTSQKVVVILQNEISKGTKSVNLWHKRCHVKGRMQVAGRAGKSGWWRVLKPSQLN